MSFTESDAFDTAAAEAVSEVEGGTTEVAAESTPSEPVVSEVTSTTETTPSEPTGEAPWWQDRLDETVDVGGQQVPLRELQQGYLRQADYTRKTQAIADRQRQAEWADNLQTMLRNDPVGTLRQMAEEFRLIPQGQEEYDPSEVDPYAERFHEVEQRLNAVALRETEALIRQEVADAKARYADFSDDVLALVAELGSNGVGLTIEQGYHLWKGQQTTAREAAEREARVRAEAVAAAEAAKRTQAGTVNGGHSPAAPEGDDPARYRGMSFEEIADEVFAGWDS